MDAYKYVTSAEDLGAIANEISRSDAVGLDIETTSLDPRLGVVRLCQLRTRQGWYVVDLFKTKTLGPIAAALSNDEGAAGKGCPVVIVQNAKFEQKWLLHHYGIRLWPVFDTYRASQLLHNGRNKSHDLNSIYRRELGHDSDLKGANLGASDWSGVLTKQQLDYAAEDVEHLYELRELLKEKLRQKGLNRTALTEFQAILPESVIENTGFYLNPADWTILAKENKRKAAELREVLWTELPHPDGQLGLFGGGRFNLDSPDQILKSLRRRGIMLEDSKRTSMAMIAADYPVVPKVMLYREFAKRFSSFGPKYLKHIHPVTGRIHTSFFPFTGAGRYACLVAGSPVRTPDGTRPIESLQPGDLVWTHKGRWRKLLDTMRKGRRRVISVKLSNEETIICSETHQFLTPGEHWFPAEMLVTGSVLQAVHGAPITVESVDASGYAEVYDVAVDEDESYACCGVFSHNSSKPNLQQIPRSSDFRSCFQAEDGFVLLFADYSQIELRLAAELSQDPMLLKIFRDGLDPHIMTASLISGVPYDQVTKAQRQLGKPINFGLIYGLMPAKLVIYAQANYGVTMSERQARVFWDRYFENYTGMRRWQEDRWAIDKPRKQSRTIAGRLRYLESETAHNEFLNTPVQGSGADGLKNALACVERLVRKYGSDVRMVHMVHDEIGLEVRHNPELVSLVKADLELGMIQGMQPILKSVPCEADAKWGRTWADAK